MLLYSTLVPMILVTFISTQWRIVYQLYIAFQDWFWLKGCVCHGNAWIERDPNTQKSQTVYKYNRNKMLEIMNRVCEFLLIT